MATDCPMIFGEAEDTRSGDVTNESETTTIRCGSFGKKPIAVQKIAAGDLIDVEKLRQLDHKNITRIYVTYLSSYVTASVCSLVKMQYFQNCGQQGSCLYWYFATDSCQYKLDEYVKKNDKPKPIECIIVLKQITKGLYYLHSCDTVHRNLNPTNVLFHAGYKQVWTVKITGFGCRKHETTGFVAPEILANKEDPNWNKAADVYSLGAIFEYTWCIGGGEICLLEDKYMDSMKSLIQEMMQDEPNQRKSLGAVMKHHLFWSGDKTVLFFERVSTFLQGHDNREELGKAIEMRFEDVAGKCWEEKFDLNSVIRKTIKDRGYGKRNTLCQLLKVIRNWSVHYYDISTKSALRSELGEHPDGFAELFTTKYPKLLPHIYSSMETKKGRKQFRQFYEVLEDEKESDSNDDTDEGAEESRDPFTGIIVFSRAKDGVYLCGSNQKSEIYSENDKELHLKRKDIERTSELGDIDTISVVAIGCRIYAIAWIGYIFVVDLSVQTPSWDEEKAVTNCLHGRFPPTAVVGGGIYICGGGWDKDFKNPRLLTVPKASKECEMFDTMTGSIKDIPAMQHARRCNSLVAVGDKLYSIGGQNHDGKLLDTVEMLDTACPEQDWVIVGNLNRPRFEASTVALHENIFLLGGKVREGDRNAPAEDIQVYSTKNKTCCYIRSTNIQPFRRVTACVQDGKVYIVGRSSGRETYPCELSIHVLDGDQLYSRRLHNKQHPEAICVAASF